MPILAQLLIGVALIAIGLLLSGQPKREKPPTVEDLEDPTASAGRPIPVVFGTVEVTGLNILYFGEKGINTRYVDIAK